MIRSYRDLRLLKIIGIRDSVSPYQIILLIISNEFSNKIILSNVIKHIILKIVLLILCN